MKQARCEIDVSAHRFPFFCSDFPLKQCAQKDSTHFWANCANRGQSESALQHQGAE